MITAPDSKPDLLPCPFCGGYIGLVVHKGAENIDDCLHRSDKKWGPKLAAVTCVCGVSTPRFHTGGQAVNWWNRRTQPVDETSTDKT